MKELDKISEQSQSFLTRRKRRGNRERGNPDTKGLVGGKVASVRRLQMRRIHHSGRR